MVGWYLGSDDRLGSRRLRNGRPQFLSGVIRVLGVRVASEMPSLWWSSVVEGIHAGVRAVVVAGEKGVRNLFHDEKAPDTFPALFCSLFCSFLLSASAQPSGTASWNGR